MRPVDVRGAVVTLLTEEEPEHAVTRSKRLVFKCILQSLGMQNVWLLAEKG